MGDTHDGVAAELVAASTDRDTGMGVLHILRERINLIYG